MYVATIKGLFLVGLYKVWDREGSTVGSLSDVLFKWYSLSNIHFYTEKRLVSGFPVPTRVVTY